MDSMSDSDINLDYNSDEIDSDLEVRLYGSIHHSFRTDGQQLTEDCHQLDMNSDNRWTQLKAKEPKIWTNDRTDRPLNSLFRILDNKLDESDDEFNDNLDFKDIYDNKNEKTIECIQIDGSSDDSSDDSDVVIIDDILPKNRLKDNTIGHKKSTSTPKADISLGNVDNLNASTLSAIESMNEFYDEDVYDSEAEEKSYNAMNGDKRLWKISFNDIHVNHNKSNRYYRNKIICRNCSERGHQERECPLPKKSPICFMCGNSGHRMERCKSILCSRCLSRSHRTIRCNVSVNQLVCDECGVRGHETNQCTYNWRKYHLTTTYTPEEPIISNLSPNVRKCCYNCGAIGKHFGFECSKPKSMDRHMIPVSPLMPYLRESHCFNGKKSNNRRNGSNDYNQKALCNEFVKSISSNELTRRLSASFNKPLDEPYLIQTSATSSATTSASIAHSFNNNKKNKHIKWIYPEMNGTLSYASDSTDSSRNCQKNIAFGKREERKRRIFNDSSLGLDVDTTASALHSAHTQPTTQWINNSMQKESQTQTTPQLKEELNERSKRRKYRRKMRKIEEKERKQQLIRESYISQKHSTIPYDTSPPKKAYRHQKWLRNRIKKRTQTAQTFCE